MKKYDINEWHPNLWPPFSQICYSTPPERVLSGKGSLLFRENKPPLIDAISSWWVTLHGHSNEYIASAIAQQARELEQVIFADFSHPQAEKLASRLSKKTGLSRLFFSDNGSTAVEVALKMACQYWQNNKENRQQIIAFNGAYHGDTFGAMSLGERTLFNEPFQNRLFPISRLPWPNTWWGDEEIIQKESQILEELKELLKTPTAAIILEPLVQGAGGMSMIRKEFLIELEILVKENNVLLILDEVLTGFGRCGDLFAFQRACIKPDLITLSKGLTGGFLPMGVTMAKEELFKGFIGEDPKLTLWHGHSFTGNPLGCAAANASLDLLEKSPELAKVMESSHKKHLISLQENYLVEKIRLTGTIAAFNLKVNDNKGYLNRAGKIIQKFALEKGVFIRPLGDVIYLIPPLCITSEQLAQCYDAIKYSLKQLEI